MSRKKDLPRPETENIFGLEIQPTVCKCPSIALERFCFGSDRRTITSSFTVVREERRRTRLLLLPTGPDPVHTMGG
jgi:hypothetical protein